MPHTRKMRKSVASEWNAGNSFTPLITEADVVVTTSHSPNDDMIERARTIAGELGCPFSFRSDKSLEDMRAATDRQHLIVLTRDEVRLESPTDTFWFHPNMATRRIEAMMRGEADRLAVFADLTPGDRLLDATCGLGSDSIVASHTVGDRGCVLAVERSTLLSVLVRHGMKIYRHRIAEVVSAMRRVRVVTADAAETLKSQADRSWDVITFDPMFDETVTQSLGLDVVRMLAWPGSTTPEQVDEACRVATRCVVMKDRTPGNRLKELGFGSVSRNGAICYGRIDV